MKNDLQRKRLFYGRIIISISLFCAFSIASVMAQLTRSTEPPSLVLGGLLIGAVLILPRSTRRIQRAKSSEPEDHALAQLKGVQKWLTGVRFIYLVGAMFVWLALPALL